MHRLRLSVRHSGLGASAVSVEVGLDVTGAGLGMLRVTPDFVPQPPGGPAIDPTGRVTRAAPRTPTPKAPPGTPD
ncbi:hypothetical protein Vqi01_27440 [Micromonospora qiuiae]|uniref:Uncharacterized protein n=1 Tax=Micromonospora qiuiae TaxID=502268 RepID=A0ABQ4JBP5_9ACTN|nr:hypothetical protein Vqi01_27440 [Micromonospora qiuiae]